MTPSELRIRGLEKSYRGPDGPLPILRGVNLSLAAGRSAAIMGDSGSGKSTLLHIIGTLDRPDAGEVRIGDRDPFALDEPALALFRNQALGFVFQDHHLLPQCTALENVLLPTLARRVEGGRARELRERGLWLLDRVGLARRAAHFPSQLSGGERQRVAIARALIHQPALVLADEPTGNLDEDSAGAIAGLLASLARDEGTLTVVVTHSAQVAARFDELFLLRRGELSSSAGSV